MEFLHRSSDLIFYLTFKPWVNTTEIYNWNCKHFDSYMVQEVHVGKGCAHAKRTVHKVSVQQQQNLNYDNITFKNPH